MARLAWNAKRCRLPPNRRDMASLIIPPRNLAQLDGFLTEAGVPLLAELRRILPDWNKKELLDKRVVIIVGFPLMRDGRETIEATDLWSFLMLSTIREIGIDIGLWEKVG